MKRVRFALIVALTLAVAMPAAARDLRSAAAEAGQQAAETAPPRSRAAVKWTGAALFVGGMSVGLYAFINNKNGSFSEFGEADAVNKKLGAASLAAAFAGGALLFVGARKGSRAAPTVAVGAAGIRVTKRIEW